MPNRPCWVEIRTQALEHNFSFLKQIAEPHAELMAVVKANAYGHGLSICAPAAVRAGARWLGVNSVEEGVAARAVCPDDSQRPVHIVVIGGVFAGQGVAAIEHGLTPVIWEPWQLDELESAAHAAGIQAGSLSVHLEIDTGMSRQGVAPGEVGPMLARITPGSPFRLQGIMTHLFAADEADGRVTAEQLARLSEALSRIEVAGQFAEWLSVGSSAALLAGEASKIAEIAASHGMKAMLRPGLALYGVTPRFDPDFEGDAPAGLNRPRKNSIRGLEASGHGFIRADKASETTRALAPEGSFSLPKGVLPQTLKAAHEMLRPVLEWKSQVVSVRQVEAGAVVGYNGTFVATEPMRLALVAVGYADGLVRALGNRFSLLVRGQRAPIVGRISMDQTVIDVTEIEGVRAGDEVVILGAQGDEQITAYDHADATGTIPWEVFTRIGARVERRAV
jgi:alanine racemase